jgi:serine/threonine-protein kinase
MAEAPSNDPTVAADTLVPSGSATAIVVLPPPGYALGGPIGRGGMGEVLAATDLRIGREVAIKRMTAKEPDGEQVTRFLREARIQARLEHPAIVPVHELGVDEHGRPFFTMKRLAGETLHAKHVAGVSQKKLLRAYVDVCLAIDFAHARGVVHRDLKPSNIMLGDYGETYVIDWGIARVIADDAAEPRAGEVTTLDDGSTKSGSLLGTPGYMSPEQVRGHRATPAADIYALGAILFELLAGDTLHPRGERGVTSTLAKPAQSPAERAPDKNIAPELDTVCLRALAEIPEDRPTARELADAVQAYLDGDRDVERRKLLAIAQVAAANDALASAAPDGRASAMRRAGRAIVLDPENVDAANIVSGLLLDAPPPSAMPPDLAAKLDEEDRRAAADRSKKFLWAYLSLFLVLPLALVLEIKNWPLLFGFYALVLLGALTAVYFSRTGRPTASVVFVVTFALTLLFTRFAGPFVLTPVMICCGLIAITSIVWFQEHPVGVFAWTGLAVLAPIVLEWLGVLPKTWMIEDGRMIVVSDIVRTYGRLDELALIASNFIFTAVVAVMLVSINRKRREGQRRLYIQAWHLRQLLPHAKRRWG